MSDVHVCANCGRRFVDGGIFRANGNSKAGKVLNFLSDNGRWFCCEGCANQFQGGSTSPAAAGPSEAEIKAKLKAEKAERKAEKQAEKRANAEITSDFELAKIYKLCLVAGYVGIHDFFVGKIGLGFVKILIPILCIVMTISQKSAMPLAFLGVNIVLWVLDLVALKAKRFTDGKGYTIRE